jgi:stage IV sporulation protein FB
VLLAEPQPSPYDLNFRLFGVDVRVHPLFWLVSLVLAGVGDVTPGDALIWIAVVFISILVHELGHVAAYRYYGTDADVVLYSMGGLAIARNHRWRGHWSQVVISFAGPLAGFLLAGLILASLYAARVPVQLSFGLPEVVQYYFPPVGGRNLTIFLYDILFVCIYWGLVNLLPIYPLDGGQIARALFEIFGVRDGLAKSLMLSIGAAAMMALVGLEQKSFFMAIMFGMLAYQNYVALQETRGRFRRSPW